MKSNGGLNADDFAFSSAGGGLCTNYRQVSGSGNGDTQHHILSLAVAAVAMASKTTETGQGQGQTPAIEVLQHSMNREEPCT